MSGENLQEIMKKIELAAEAKVIEGYKTGQIQLPTISQDGKAMNPIDNSEHQIDVLKNIMAEGAKKFESATGRRMTYSEMREMFG